MTKSWVASVHVRIVLSIIENCFDLPLTQIAYIFNAGWLLIMK